MCPVATGHKIGEQNKIIAELNAKLETKEGLLEEALAKIKSLTHEQKEANTDTEDPEVDQ